MSAFLTEERITSCQKRFDLTYHVPYAAHCQKLVGFEGKDVLEVGGSLPAEFVFGHLGAGTWTAVETGEYEDSLREAGGLTHKGTILRSDETAKRCFDGNPLEKYNFFLDKIENLPEAYHERFDLVFSLATFEHIHKLSEALEKMYLALRPGGKLFALFAPVWSAHDGHHLPEMFRGKVKGPMMSEHVVPPWGHLLFTPPGLLAYLKEFTDEATARSVVYYVFNAPNINRFFTEDYIDFFNLSSFEVSRLDLLFPTQVPPDMQEKLEQRHPGYRHFSNNGILAVLQR